MKKAKELHQAAPHCHGAPFGCTSTSHGTAAPAVAIRATASGWPMSAAVRVAAIRLLAPGTGCTGMEEVVAPPKPTCTGVRHAVTMMPM